MRPVTSYVAALVILWTLASSNTFVSAQTRSNGKIAFSLTRMSGDAQINLVSEDGGGLTRYPAPVAGRKRT